MQVHGLAHVHGPHPLGGPHQPRTSVPAQLAPGLKLVDEVQISDQARDVAETGQLPEIRLDRVNAIRSQIASGTYETREKLEAAVERLLDEIA